MGEYEFDPVWNTYHLEPGTQDFSLVDAHGQTAANVEGNAKDNVITGNDADNVLNGSLGADTLIGGLGNDQYYVETSGDVVIEEAGEGNTDLVIAYISYLLPDHVEILELRGYDPIEAIGNDGANDLFGNSVNNRLDGGVGDDRLFASDGDDTLIGGTGADRLWGGKGGDTFFIDEDDEIVELQDEGNDWVVASFVHTLGDHLENLKLIGAQDLAGIGNGLDNHLIGASGNDTLEGRNGDDTLDGGAGADRLDGGTGNDVYRIDHADDRVIEADEGGADRVETIVSHTLAAFVEDLFALGDAALGLTGNALANSIHGNAAANTLDGGAGADTLAGGGGDDTYYVDHASDHIAEAASSGEVDIVYASVSYTVPVHVEHAVATGTGKVSLAGNDLGNRMTGNANADMLNGSGGNDTLEGGLGYDRLRGGAGKDSLKGGSGKDVFLFDSKPNKRANVDKILDFRTQDDSIWLENKYFIKLGSGSVSKPKKFKSDMFVEGKKAKDAEDRIVYDKKTGALYYDQDGTGSKAQVKIATIYSKTKPYYHDFYVI
jgi:Ca2+-binding RTX toxin-like protein